MIRDRFTDEMPFFTAEQRALATSVANFAWQEVEPRAGEEEDTDRQFRFMLALLAQADLLRFAVARRDAPLDVRALCLIRERLAYSSALADLAFVMQGLGTYAISLAATEHVGDFWLARAASGKAVAAFALTEPEVGSDVSAIATTAQKDGDTYVIRGRKRFISNAPLADFYTVFARTGTRPDGRAEISAFIVSARLPGVRLTERIDLIAAHPIGEVEFSDVRVPAEDRIGTEGEGHKLAMRTLDTFRASVGAAACGMAARALDESITYAKQRTQFGQPLASYQLIQAKLATMRTELDAARLLVYRAAYLKDSDPQQSFTEAASIAKLFATEAAWRATDEAVQIHGGAGLLRGSVVEQLYRDVRALRIYEGTSEIQKLIIANQILKDGSNKP